MPPSSRSVRSRRRARGVAFVDLPLGLRARYDVQAFHRLSPRSSLDTAFLDRPFDPARRSAWRLESRFAVSCALAPRLELALSWVARGPLSVVELLRIEDQRVAAMIRLVP